MLSVSLYRRSVYLFMCCETDSALIFDRNKKINEGMSEEEAWRLFQQLVDALVHMAGLGILGVDKLCVF